MRTILFLALTTLFGLSGCANVPMSLQGDFASATPHQSITDNQIVRWGGTIISVEPKANMTCFQVLSYRLSESARPIVRDPSTGRFVACQNGFFDPEVYQEGREITITGTVIGSEIRRVGEYDLRVPRVTVQSLHLWPKRVQESSFYTYPSPLFWSLGYDRYWYNPSSAYHHHGYYRPTNKPETTKKQGK